jgi:hypothetical protein
MPNLPVSDENDVAIQNNANGQVDYLQFQGSTLIHSDLIDYGIAGWNIVGHGPVISPENLVIQNAASGVVDFLGLDGTGHLVSSALSSALPPIIGEGIFGTGIPGGSPTFVSQLANGQLDFLAFDKSGALISSDLVANSLGLPHAVGVADANGANIDFRPFALNGAVAGDENVVTQLADGSLDAIGFSGSFGANNLSVSNNFMLPGSAGLGAVGALNPDIVVGGDNQNLIDMPSGHEGLTAVSQLAGGQLDLLNFDSGYNDASHEGVLYASNLLAPSFAGWHVADVGGVATGLFPIT